MTAIEEYPALAAGRTNPLPVQVYLPPRRSKLALVFANLGGVLIGMLLMALIVAVAGSPRAVPGAGGDPAAPYDLSIVVTNGYLTAQARASNNALIQEPQMSVGADGKVTLDARVSIIGPSLPLRATLQPTIVDGKLRLTVTKSQLGGLPLPDLVARQIEGTVAAASQMPATTVPVTLVRIETREGELVMYQKAR